MPILDDDESRLVEEGVWSLSRLRGNLVTVSLHGFSLLSRRQCFSKGSSPLYLCAATGSRHTCCLTTAKGIEALPVF